MSKSEHHTGTEHQLKARGFVSNYQLCSFVKNVVARLQLDPIVCNNYFEKMVEPVHPIVPVGIKHQEPGSYGAIGPQFTAGYFEATPDSGKETELILGQISLRWETLHPATRGLIGLVMDVKAVANALRRCVRRQDPLDEMYIPPPLTKKMLRKRGVEAAERCWVDRERNRVQLNAVTRVLTRKSQAVYKEKGFRKIYGKQWTDDDSETPSARRAYRAGTTLRSHGRTGSDQTTSTRGAELSLLQDDRSAAARTSHDRHAETVLSRCASETLKRAVFARCLAARPQAPLESTVLAVREPEKNDKLLPMAAYPMIMKPITDKITFSLTQLQKLIFPSRLTGLKSHQTLRNITRRTHGVCTLLYFPATINLQSGSSLPDLFPLPRQYKKKLHHEESMVPSETVAPSNVSLHTGTQPSQACMRKLATSEPTTSEELEPRRRMRPKSLTLPGTTRRRSVNDDDDDNADVQASLKEPRLAASTSLPNSSSQRLLFALKTVSDDNLRSQAFADYKNKKVRSGSSSASSSKRTRPTAALVPLDTYRDYIDDHTPLTSTSEDDSTASNDSFSSSESLQETDVYALTYGCGLPATWEPRLLLYGGAMQESLEDRRGNASDWLSEFPLYSLEPDEPCNHKVTQFLKEIEDEARELEQSRQHQTTTALAQGKHNASNSRHITSDTMKDFDTFRVLLSYQDNKTLELFSSESPEDIWWVILSNEEEQKYMKAVERLAPIVTKPQLCCALALRTTIGDEFPFQDERCKAEEPPQNYIFRLQSSIFACAGAHYIRSATGVAFPQRFSSPVATTARGRIDWGTMLSRGKTRTTALPGGPRITTQITSPPARFGSASVTYRGRLYIFGGAGVVHWRKPTLMNDLWVLAPLAEEEQSTYEAMASLYSSNDARVAGYVWQEVPLSTALRPPPCAFHLAAVHDGFMYVLISDCMVPDSLDDSKAWVTRTAFSATEASDHRVLLNAEYNRAEKMCVKPNVLRAYQKRLERSKTSINQIWRIDLDSVSPQWEHFEVTISKQMPRMVSGGVALAFYNNRLFVYGTITGHSSVAIGVLDVRLRMWVTWVKLPGAPVWVTAVAIGKLWFLFGVEVWGIFNFETFEWRHSNAPPKATIRYGSNSVWLPPYTPFPPSFEVSPLCKALSGLGPRELRTMLRTDLATQYFWLMLQGRRPMDHVHTILLVGGFDAKGQLSNQVDQVLVALPPELATSCFYPVWREANLFYASLFGVDTMRGLLQSDHHVRRLNRMQDQESEKNGTTNEKEYIIQSLCKEVERLHEKNSILQEAHASNVRQMEHRFFSRQRQLQQRLSTKEDNIRELQLRLERERLLRQHASQNRVVQHRRPLAPKKRIQHTHLF